MIGIALAALVLVLLLQYLSEVCALDALEVTHAPSVSLVEQEGIFELVLTFTNRSRLPISFLRFRETLPQGMIPVSQEETAVEKDAFGRLCLVGTAWLRPRQRLEKRLTVCCLRRGRFTLHALDVRGGDFLGIREFGRSYPCFAEVVVYPHSLDRPVDEVLGGLMGELSVRRYLFEDPILTVGCRDYTGREPMRSISWSQSAKAGTLMVRQADFTAEPTVSVAVGMDRDGDEEAAEQCLRLARGICEDLERRGVKYEFRINAPSAGGLSAWCQVSDGRGQGHLSAVLEGLGRAGTAPLFPLERLVRPSVSQAQASRGLILILPHSIPLGQLRRRVESQGGTLRAIVAGEVAV